MASVLASDYCSFLAHVQRIFTVYNEKKIATTSKPEIKRWLWLFAGSMQHQHGIAKTEITKDKTLKCSREKKNQKTLIATILHVLLQNYV